MGRRGRRCAAVAVLVAGLGGCHRPAAESTSAPPERWRAIDRGPVAEYWRCLFAKEVDVGSLRNGQQIRRLVEDAYAGRGEDDHDETFADHVTTSCLPALARARQSLTALGAASPTAEGGADGYAASLEALEAATRALAERTRRREPLEEESELIPAGARAWQAAIRPSAEVVSYDLFLRCVVPDVDALKDAQAVYERLAERCFRADPVAFTDDVRARCLPLLRSRTKARTAPRSVEATRRRLRDERPRQAQAWSRCLELAEEQRALHDGAELVAAANAYLAARAPADAR